MSGELRQAWRALIRRPLLFTVAASALALGIGASTAVFTIADAVLLRPLPFTDPGRLVLLWQSIPERNAPFVEVSFPYFVEVRKRSRTMAARSSWRTAGRGPGASRACGCPWANTDVRSNPSHLARATWTPSHSAGGGLAASARARSASTQLGGSASWASRIVSAPPKSRAQ